MKDIFAIALARFKILGGIIGDIQGRAIVGILYFTAIVPFALLIKATSDPLHTKPDQMQPRWLEREPVQHEIEQARLQG